MASSNAGSDSIDMACSRVGAKPWRWGWAFCNSSGMVVLCSSILMYPFTIMD